MIPVRISHPRPRVCTPARLFERPVIASRGRPRYNAIMDPLEVTALARINALSAAVNRLDGDDPAASTACCGTSKPRRTG